MEEALDALSLTLVVEAEIPEGWPEPSPPGLVRVKSYPGVRLARVSEDQTSNSLFRELFRHIDRNDISMTSPVEMNVPGEPGSPFMSFLYASEATGPTGREGAVEVLDAAKVTVVSVAVRGAYTDGNFREGLETVRAWLADPACEWQEAGDPRVLA